MSIDRPTIGLFFSGLFRSLWTYLVIVGTALTLFLLPRQWYWLIPTGAVILVVLSALRVVSEVRSESGGREASGMESWQKQVSGLQAEIKQRDQEIARLKVRPYEEAQCQAVQSKLKAHSYIERDLLRFLLQRGETVGALIYQHSQTSDAFCTQALERLTREGLLQVRTDLSRPLIEQPRFWRINPTFESVLHDLLYPREEAQVTPAFVV